MLQNIFDMFKKKSDKKDAQASRAIFSINGMHCVSCSMNIDANLEDLPGVTQAKTSYAKAKTVVSFDASQVTISDLQKSIEALGYKAAAI